MPLSRLLLVLSGAALAFAQNSPSEGTTAFVFDGNRMYAELAFVRPDGSLHRALAFVDMGSPVMTLTESLFQELQLDRDKPLLFRLGELAVEIRRADVISQRGKSYPVGSNLRVEAILPAGVLRRYQVTIDYRQRTLTLAQPGTAKPEGVPVPFQIDAKTGLIAVNATIDGELYAITIDNGSAYTWVRQSAAKDWLAHHPTWERGVGAVGPANMRMSGDATEKAGILLRLPEISLGSLNLKDAGALAAGSVPTLPGNLDFFDWYSRKNAVPVIGWIGGNVLKAFRLTVDYPNRVIYWLPQADPDSHDLDQVGITLQSRAGAYFVAAIVTRHGKPTVEGVLPGDKLLRAGQLDLEGATWGAIYAALHGKPGDSRELLLERDGKRLTVTVPVTGF